MKHILALALITGLLFSCSKENIEPIIHDPIEPTQPTVHDPVVEPPPADTGGTQKAFYKGSTQAPFGFYLYTPGGYANSGAEYPLLVFLHGKGEIGNSQKTKSDLEKVLRFGPPMLIDKKKWHPKHPMIVASPQSDVNGWNAQKIQDFITYIMGKYRVDKRRIYVTGLSMGGFGAFAYAALGDQCRAAAVVPLSGGGSISKASEMAKTPIWAFHGGSDHTVNVSNSINTIAAINAQKPSVQAKLTIYPGVDHNCWEMTYEGTGMGKESTKYDRFNQDVFDWMF